MKLKTTIYLLSAVSAAALLEADRPLSHRQLDYQKVVYKDECSTVSDPSDMAVFTHEDIVNSFLSVKGKFGRGRVLMMPFNHERFARHNGTLTVPQDWQDEHQQYELAEWGMVGGLDVEEPRLYYLKQALPTAIKQPPEKGEVKVETALNERTTDAFENYAVEQLVKGERLVKWERPEFMRFVGAIRAAASCLSCHAEAKEGDVLGAFAFDYTKKPLPKDTKPDPAVTAARAGKPKAELLKLMEQQKEGWRDYELRTRLAKGGVVSQDMIEQQTKTRAYVLNEAVQLSRERQATGATVPAPPGKTSASKLVKK